jgi:hypothetical protein
MTMNGLELLIRVGPGILLTANDWSLVSVPLTRQVSYLERYRHFIEIRSESAALIPQTPIEVSFFLGSYLLQEIEGTVVSTWTEPGRLVIEIDGSGCDYLALHFLKTFVNDWKGVSWDEFEDESSRESWLLACLWFRDRLVLPSETLRTVVLRDDCFTDRASLFCLLGESVLGYRGYVGRDLDGLDESIRWVVSKGFSIEVRLTNPGALKQKVSSYSRENDFFDMFATVMRANGVVIGI